MPGLSYSTALFTAASDLTRLTGVQDVANLAADGELSLATFILEAQRFVYRRIEKRQGIDPGDLANGDRLESAVAYETLMRLALAGYLGDQTLDDRERLADIYRRKRDEELEDFYPDLESAGTTDHGGGLDDGVPAFGGFPDETGWATADPDRGYDVDPSLPDTGSARG